MVTKYKVKYFGVNFCCNTNITDLSDICRKFYGQFTSISSALGKCSSLHLTKTYSHYGCEIWKLTDNSLQLCTQSLLHITIVSGKFLSVVDVRALKLFSFLVKQCQ